MTTYSKTSPYSNTQTFGFFLDVAQIRDIPKLASDKTFTVTAVYKHRPDLLANDLYGDPALWWIFAVRNPNSIEDPVFDFIPGLTIYVPKKETIDTALGL